MKRLAFLVAAFGALAFPIAASAHPLGNFTINRFSRIEMAGSRVYVKYVVDLAEIPTLQSGRIDAQRLARGLRLRLGRRREPLIPVEVAVAHPPGAAGLKTTRFEAILRGPVLRGRAYIVYHDSNYANRIGWKEIAVGDAPSLSDELRAYPKNLLSSPLDVTSVHTSLVPTTGPATRPRLTRGGTLLAPDRVADSGFASLVARDDLGVWVILASLAVALFWGAAHALSPGHGKAIIAAYLVGRRGTPRHAALLGLIVTVTHTVGVFALGLVTLLLSRFVVPEQLYPWLNVVSGVLVIGIGASVLRARWRHRHRHHHHEHEHELGGRSLLVVGVSGGLLPCPSALVVLLAAISLHRIGFGLLLIVAFSLGLALTITGVGLVAVLARSTFHRIRLDGAAASLLPTLSALVIVAAGIAMTVRAV